MEEKRKNLFFCYRECVAKFLMSQGLTPDFHGVNRYTDGEYWAFERGEALDAGLDAWQKHKWVSKPKQGEAVV